MKLLIVKLKLVAIDVFRDSVHDLDGDWLDYNVYIDGCEFYICLLTAVQDKNKI